MANSSQIDWLLSWATVALVAAAGCGPAESGTDAGAETGQPDAGPATDAAADADGAVEGDAVDGSEEAGPGRQRIVIRGIDFTASSWTVTGGDRVRAVQTEEGDGVEGRTASGEVTEPFERDVVYTWGGIEELKVDGSSRAVVDGEIRRNGPETLEREPPGEEPAIRMTIHASVELLRRNGRAGEKMVARYAAEAFEEAGYGYEIAHKLMPEQPPDEKSNCSAGEAPEWWGKQIDFGEVDVVRKDANVLMLDANGGGCGAIAGDHGTTPGRNIDELREWTEIGTDDDWHRNMHGTLHEIGHQLGARHDHRDDEEGQQHWGSAWHEDDGDGELWWHRTPNTAGNGAPNFCGESIEKRRRDEETGVRRHQVYSECAAERFAVVDPSDSE